MSILTDNPVLQKEMRGRLRARRQTRNARIGSGILLLASVAIVYYFSLTSLFGNLSESNRSVAAEGLFGFCTMGLGLTLVLFISPALAASAITQEREQQTWNALLLSRLTPLEIVFGKYLSALTPALLALALVFPLQLIGAVLGDVPFFRFISTGILILLTLAFCTAVSLFWSSVCRRTYIATSAAFGSIAFLVIGTYILYGLTALSQRMGGSFPPNAFPLMWINPYYGLSTLLDKGNTPNAEVGIFCCVAYFLGTLGLLTVITRRLYRGPKELEQ